MTNTTEQGLTTLEQLAAEAQMYSINVRMNLFQLARVFSDARKLLPHGEWGKWVKDNAGVEMRTAQQMIQIGNERIRSFWQVGIHGAKRMIRHA